MNRFVWQRVALVVISTLLMGACGRAEQSADQRALDATMAASADRSHLVGTYPEPQMSLAVPEGVYPEPLSLSVATPEPPLIYPESPDDGLPYWEPTPPPPPQQTQTAVVIETNFALTNQTRQALATISAYTPTPELIIVPAPYGPPLREVWPHAPEDTPRVSELLLVVNSELDNSNPAVWRVQLPSGQQERLSDLDRGFSGAALSADQQQLAYLAGSTDNPLLRVKDLASQQETYFTGFPVASHTFCRSSVAWSPQGRMLAIATYNAQNEQYQLRVYTGGAPAQSKVLLERPLWVELIGWLDAERVLVYVREETYKQQPVRFIVVNWRSGAQQELASVPAPFIVCPRLSPDRRKVLFLGSRDAVDDGRLMLDTATGQISPSGIQPEESMVWGADGMTMLQPSTDDGRTMKLRRLDQPEAANTFLTFGPAMRSTAVMRLLDASPDGRWLLVCTSRGSTWLYEIAAERWIELGNGCAQPLGWWPRREDTH